MRSRIQEWKVMTFLGMLLFLSDIASAEGQTYGSRSENKTDTVSLFLASGKMLPDHLSSGVDSFLLSRRLFHRVGVEIRPDYIFPTNSFLRGDNNAWEPIRNASSVHLKYSFQYHPYTNTGRIYRDAYQGIGLACYTFEERKQLGNPIAIYLFQGARIKRFSPRLSLNYEWNFGLSFGWKPYDYEDNYYNIMIGSKINAYLNTDLYLNWMLSRQFDLTGGITLSHFSNGNTKFPNAGLNTTGLNLGLVYNLDRRNYSLSNPFSHSLIPEFPRHISYDLVFFGSWRRKGVVFGDGQVASPDAYTVLGFNFAPMYNFGYKLRAGVSVDGIYDGSANVYTEDYIVGAHQEFFKPSLSKQLALGISGRGEYVMPYFTVGIGMGVNVLHGGGDLKAFYQMVALKIEVTRNSFIHIGYNLKDFHDPNFLMLGIGFHFNNKYPIFHRK
ncbi:MAG: acyloxyacyl hydrolase [Mangrovibacterium sp.]